MSRPPSFQHDLSDHLDPESDKIDTVLMSGAGSEQVFDDLRQRYERRVESQEYRLLEGHESPAPIERRGDASNSDVSLEPAPPQPIREPEVPWYAWMLVIASFVLLLAASATVLVLFA